MGFVKGLSQRLTLLAVLWLVATLSLVGWWWYHAITTFSADERLVRMFLWEGAFLFVILFVGGAGLIHLSRHHQMRLERLRMFFATFAHDLKTSMTRLRLQAELLEESGLGKDPKVKTMLKNIQKLDLQLENSLWLAQLDSNSFLIQSTRLSDVMDHLRNEFSEMRFEVSHDAEIFVDRRAFTVILRNLFQNAHLHGNAERIQIKIWAVSAERVQIDITDDGSGLKAPVDRLGKEILATDNHKSNGLGLYLCRRLIERMEGELVFTDHPVFTNVLTLRGRLR